jgi:BMFP domain-containing protein YqiC
MAKKPEPIQSQAKPTAEIKKSLEYISDDLIKRQAEEAKEVALNERLAALEAKVAALEKKLNEMWNDVFFLKEWKKARMNDGK